MTLLNRALNFLFPPYCKICGKQGDFEICENCIKRIKRLEKYQHLKLENRSLDELIYFFKYENDIRKMILSYKFFNKYYFGKVFAKIMLKNEKFCGILEFYDIIIPVPMHKSKIKERGYNQAELLAENLVKDYKALVYEKSILIKAVNNKKQSSLSEKERYSNIKNVFKVQNSDKIKEKRIILVDDICTTSATLEECSKILKEAGAKYVTAVVIAKD